jgi:hypothetical protein
MTPEQAKEEYTFRAVKLRLRLGRALTRSEEAACRDTGHWLALMYAAVQHE